MTTETSNKPVRRTFMVADVKCYLCGAVAGSVEREELPGQRMLTFRRPADQQGRAIRDWRTLRCHQCGGSVYLDNPEVVTRRSESYNWLDERPRRGRPPKALVEERRRERELLESQAA